MKKTIKITAIIIAMALVVTSICNHGVAAAKATKVGNGMYTVTSEKNKTARLDKISSKTKTTLVIPATVKIGKKTYKVVAVKPNALKGNKKIKKLTIGKNVKTIGKNAFSGCKNLKTINIKTTKLTLKSVGKNAFKGLNSKANIKVPASKLTTYQKLLKARGVNGGKQTVKSDKAQTADTKKPTVLSTPTATFRTGVPMTEGYYWKYTTTEADCVVGETVEFSIRVDNPLDYYGYWEKKKNIKSNCRITCTACQIVVSSEEDWSEHGAQTGHTGYTIYDTKKSYMFDASVWHPDNTPFSIVYHTTLSEGLELAEDSISIAKLSRIGTLLDAVDSNNYKVSVEGKSLIITINNIKAGGFRHSSGDMSYLPIVASFSAKVTDSASAVNPVTANVSYNCGKNSGVIDTNTVTINKK